MRIAVFGRLVMFGVIVSSLLLSPSAKASGQKGDMASIKHEHCEKSKNLENTFCMSRELEESDRRLNVIYKTLMSALVKPQGLQSAQRAWIAFRDTECRFQNEAMQGGSGYNFSMYLCLMQLTEQRIAALEEVQPCNGCMEFKDEFYGAKNGFSFPERKRIPASGKP